MYTLTYHTRQLIVNQNGNNIGNTFCIISKMSSEIKKLKLISKIVI